MNASSRTNKRTCLEKVITKPGENSTEEEAVTSPFLHNGNRCCPSLIFTGVTGLVTHIFPANQFKFKNGTDGISQSFINVDELSKTLGVEIYRYKVTAWNEVVSKLNIAVNNTYTISQLW